jgi:hypothetical protein
MIPARLIYLGLILKATSNLSYLRETVLGRNKPNRVSHAMWAFAAYIAFFGQLGEGVSVLDSGMTLTVAVLTTGTLIASFTNKKAHWKLKSFDYICGVFSFAGIVLWQITDVGLWAIIFGVIGHGFAYLPTIKKSYASPYSETAHAYALNVVGISIFLLALDSYSVAAVVFPAYILLIDGAVFLLLMARRKKIN